MEMDVTNRLNCMSILFKKKKKKIIKFQVTGTYRCCCELGCRALVTSPLLVSLLLFIYLIFTFSSICVWLWCSIIMCCFPFVSIVHACESFFLPQAPLFSPVPFL